MKKVTICICMAALMFCMATTVQALSFDMDQLDFGSIEVDVMSPLQTTYLSEAEPGFEIVRILTVEAWLTDDPDAGDFLESHDIGDKDSAGRIPFYFAFLPRTIGDKSLRVHVFAAIDNSPGDEDNTSEIGVHAYIRLNGTGVDTGTSVPDASIILLLGSSLIGLVGFGRRSKRS